MNNKEVLQEYNQRLGQNNTDLQSIMSAINDLPNVTDDSGVEYNVNNVNFLDYDGTCLYSYDLETVKSRSELPPLPTGGEFPAKMWNWTLEEIITKNQPVDVGVIYDYGDIILQLKINVDDRIVNHACYINYGKKLSSGTMNFSVDWGDGTTEERTLGDGSLYHTYQNTGPYTITVRDLTMGNQQMMINTYNSNSSYYFPHWWSSGTGSSAAIKNKDRAWYAIVTDIIFGDRCYFNINTIYLCQSFYGLKTVRFGDIQVYLSSNAFYYTTSLKACIYPRNIIRNINVSNGFYHSDAEFISFPYALQESTTTTAMFGSYFAYTRRLRKVVLPENIPSLGAAPFYYSYSITNVILPNSITNIPQQAFNYAFIMFSVNIPTALTSISNSAFSGCYTLGALDFSHLSAIPSLGSSAFAAISDAFFKIIVPDDLYDDWIVATNWSTYASYIVKASEA